MPTQPSPGERPGGRLLVLPFLLVPIILAGAVLVGLLASPIDLTETLGIPRSVDRYLQRDRLAYPVHAELGSLFNSVGLPPTAAAIQWLKAAAHATSEEQLGRAAAGIATAAARDGDGTRVSAVICPLVRRKSKDHDATAVARSGLPC